MHLHRVVVDQQEIIAKEDLDRQDQQDRRVMVEIKDQQHQQDQRDLKDR